MSLVTELLKKAVDRGGFVREKFEESKQPTDSSNLLAIPFFGDIRSTFLFSSIFLHRWKEILKPSKYVVLCSWPGMSNLFPYVDEYWSPKDVSQFRSLLLHANGFKNHSEISAIHMQNLNEFFRETADVKSIVLPYYDRGIKQDFFESFGYLKRFLPGVSSSAILGKEFNNNLVRFSGHKVLITPTIHAKIWKNGSVVNNIIPKLFWKHLLEHLCANGYTPVVWQNYMTYDLSSELTDKCVFFVEKEMTKVLALMRSVGVVVDIFQGLSKFALAARCSCISYNERMSFNNLKEYEVEDLCNSGVPIRNIFTFGTLIGGNNPSIWSDQIYKGLVKNLDDFVPSLDRDSWPSTNESYEKITYDQVRVIKRKDFGLKLFDVKRD